MNRLRTAVLILFAITAAAYGYMKISERLADDTPPVITADSDTVEVSVNDGEEKLLSGIKATDRQDGDLTASVTGFRDIQADIRKHGKGVVHRL